MLAAALVGLVAAVIAAVPAAAAVQVRITPEGFKPDEVKVVRGEPVVWVNDTDTAQVVVGEDGSWDSGALQPGESFSVVLRDDGVTLYGTADGAFVGTIAVVAAADEPSAPVPASEELAVTGPDPWGLVGWALVLIGTGALLLQSTPAPPRHRSGARLIGRR